jgi:hypothetical protein
MLRAQSLILSGLTLSISAQSSADGDKQQRRLDAFVDAADAFQEDVNEAIVRDVGTGPATDK